MPRCFLVLLFTALLGFSQISCATSANDEDDDDSILVKVSGNAYGFPNYEKLAGAQISVLEFPNKTTTAGADGYYEIGGLPVGAEVSLVIKMDGYIETQTKTFTLPMYDVDKITFQVPSDATVIGLSAMISVTLAEDKCQVVSTVTRVGKSIYDSGAHGEAGAIVEIDPPIDADSGPVYFNESVLPDRNQAESSLDGGVLYTNVEPGEYILRAEKSGVSFEEVKIKCRAGVLINASPPYGLQALP